MKQPHKVADRGKAKRVVGDVCAPQDARLISASPSAPPSKQGKQIGVWKRLKDRLKLGHDEWLFASRLPPRGKICLVHRSLSLRCFQHSERCRALGALSRLVPASGLEPEFSDSESAVLPLDDAGSIGHEPSGARYERYAARLLFIPRLYLLSRFSFEWNVLSFWYFLQLKFLWFWCQRVLPIGIAYDSAAPVQGLKASINRTSIAYIETSASQLLGEAIHRSKTAAGFLKQLENRVGHTHVNESISAVRRKVDFRLPYDVGTSTHSFSNDISNGSISCRDQLPVRLSLLKTVFRLYKCLVFGLQDLNQIVVNDVPLAHFVTTNIRMDCY